jgi:hypothetical protein
MAAGSTLTCPPNGSTGGFCSTKRSPSSADEIGDLERREQSLEHLLPNRDLLHL